jgi:hypothetical protein
MPRQFWLLDLSEFKEKPDWVGKSASTVLAAFKVGKSRTTTDALCALECATFPKPSMAGLQTMFGRVAGVSKVPLGLMGQLLACYIMLRENARKRRAGEGEDLLPKLLAELSIARNPVAELRSGRANVSITVALEALQLHNVRSEDDPWAADSMTFVQSMWDRWPSTSRRDMLRTMLLALRGRAPDILDWIGRNGPLCKPADLAAFIATFEGSLGDGSTTDTKIPVKPEEYCLFLWHTFRQNGLDEMDAALSSKCAQKLFNMLRGLNGLGGTGFAAGTLVQCVLDADAGGRLGIKVLSGMKARLHVGPGPRAVLNLALGRPTSQDKYSADEAAEACFFEALQKLQHFAKEALPAGLRGLACQRTLQFNLCKLMSVIAFLASGKTGSHKRLARKRQRLDDSDSAADGASSEERCS